MDEQPRRSRFLPALLWLPLALILVVPAVVLLAIAFYVRAAVSGVASLVRYLWGFKPVTGTSTQRPHLLKISVGVKKGQ